MKIGIIKETKIPEDNRVALTPLQIKALKEKFPHVSFKVQPSPIRAYRDQEYSDAGIELSDDLSDCDLLLGIKEAETSTILPGKHYIFFGHIAKMQSYNKHLFKDLLAKDTIFSDYEYLVDDAGQRLVAFGWYAGVVGVYYTLAAWGRKLGLYDLPKPTLDFTLEDLENNLKNSPIGNVKIVLTGDGRVSQGAQHLLSRIGAVKLDPEEYLSTEHPDGIVYCVLSKEHLVSPNDAGVFDEQAFQEHPENFHSTFMPYQKSSDILISCHFWAPGQPVYLTEEDFLSPDFRIKVIGDITCDIQGSIRSTLRSSTHAQPFYDFNPHLKIEEEAFSAPGNITVMAVDTCPNALPRETSAFFGTQLVKYVLNDLLSNEKEGSGILDRATIVRNGKLTEYFNYLNDYVKTL